MQLLDLIKGKNYIAGSWVECEDQLTVINPATGETIATVPNLSNAMIVSAIDSTVDSFTSWSKTSANQRSNILRKWHKLIMQYIDQLAYIVTVENGKILEDAKSEIIYGASFIEWFANVIDLNCGTIKDGNSVTHKIITEYEAVGAVAAITPWNFPNAMITRKLAPALAAGCSVILKPSELTPLSALALAKLLEEAGLAKGVVNIVTTNNAEQVGRIFCEDFRIRKLSFTGSTATGKILYQNCSSTLKRLSLELGGNAPFIIFSDADLEQATSDLITAKIRSGGQSCISPNRILIASAIYDQVINLLQEKFLPLKTGNGLDPQSNIGAMINTQAVEKVLYLLADATNKGARIIGGGKANGKFLLPTLIIDCNDQMDIFHTEIFAPVIACYKYDDIEQVVTTANDTEYGLQAYLYTNNFKLASVIANKLDFGMISINSPKVSNAKAAFGGRKNSGFGVEGSEDGIFEYLNTKYINLQY